MYTRDQVVAHVEEELEEFFRRLVNRYGLQSGDEDPGMAFRWDEDTKPAIIDYVWSWYSGNQVPYVIVEALDLGLCDLGENRRAAFRYERKVTQTPRGIEFTEYFDNAGAEPLWGTASVMEPMERPELQERIRLLLDAVR